MDIAKLGYKIDSSDARRASRDLDRMGRETVEADRAAGRLSGSTMGMGRALGIAAGAAGAFFAAIQIRDLIRAADQFSQLTGRISLFTDSAGETREVIAGLDRVAFNLGTTLSSVGELYARLAPAQDALGYSSEQLLAVTEAVTSSLIVSGASATEAQASIIQLAQGLASGALRGDEFNSVAEQSPRLMRLLADSLDVSVGELREMAAEGQLTADVVGGALLGSVDTLRGELEDLPLTVERASQSLRGELTLALQTFNEELGLTDRLARGIMVIASGMRQDRVGLEFQFMDDGEIRAGLNQLEEFRTRAARLIAEAGAEGISEKDAIQGFILRLDAAEDLLGRETLSDLEARAERDGTSYAGAFLQAIEDRIAQGRAELFDFQASSRLRAPVTGNRADTATSGLLDLLSEIEPIVARHADARERAAEAAAREAEFLRQQAAYDYAGLETEMWYEAGGEFARLEDQHSQRLAILREARELELITEREFLARRQALIETYEASRQSLLLSSAATTFGALTSLAETFAGEQSGIYKALFLTEKAFALSSAIINAHLAISKAAAAAPFPANIPLIAGASAQTLPQVAMIAAQTAQGFRSGGYTGDGPMGSVAGVVHGREYVLNADATASIGRHNLDHMNRYGAMPANDTRGGGSGGGSVVNVHIGTIKAGSDVTRADVERSVRMGVAEGIRDQVPAKVIETLDGNMERSGNIFGA